MKDHHPILKEIDAFLSHAGWSDAYFGKKAVNNSELVGRLRKGQSVHFRTEARIRDFISDHSPTSAAPSERRAG